MKIIQKKGIYSHEPIPKVIFMENYTKKKKLKIQ